MSKIYGEPVDVQARDDGRPTGFVWRSRRYTVRAILEHWVINRDWWRDPQSEPGQLELELWRVEASPTPAAPACPYELRREAAPACSYELRREAAPACSYELRREAATDAWTLRPS